MRSILAALLFASAALAGRTAPAPKYVPLELARMVAEADLIVRGTIVELEAETFRLAIDEVIAGSTGLEPGEPLEVERFRDWPCARRYAQYAIGQ